VADGPAASLETSTNSSSTTASKESVLSDVDVEAVDHPEGGGAASSLDIDALLRRADGAVTQAWASLLGGDLDASIPSRPPPTLGALVEAGAVLSVRSTSGVKLTYSFVQVECSETRSSLQAPGFIQPLSLKRDVLASSLCFQTGQLVPLATSRWRGPCPRSTGTRLSPTRNRTKG
jgi:hypothetical protein